MNSLQLELEEVLEELKEYRGLADLASTQTDDDWEAGYACGQKAAYDDAIDRCKGLMEFTTSVHTES